MCNLCRARHSVWRNEVQKRPRGVEERKTRARRRLVGRVCVGGGRQRVSEFERRTLFPYVSVARGSHHRSLSQLDCPRRSPCSPRAAYTVSLVELSTARRSQTPSSPPLPLRPFLRGLCPLLPHHNAPSPAMLPRRSLVCLPAFPAGVS